MGKSNIFMDFFKRISDKDYNFCFVGGVKIDKLKNNSENNVYGDPKAEARAILERLRNNKSVIYKPLRN